MTQFQRHDVGNGKIDGDYLSAEISAEDLKNFFDTSKIRKKNKWYSFLIACLFFSFFLLLYFNDSTGKTLWELLPFFLLVCTFVYFYSRRLLNRFQFSPLKDRPLCYVDLQYVYIEFREPFWKKKLEIPIEQVQLLLGNICDDSYFHSISCKNKNDEVLLLDFTFVNWQEIFDHSELIVPGTVGVSQPRTYFFHTPRIVCCVNSIQYADWYKRFSHCCPCPPTVHPQE